MVLTAGSFTALMHALSLTQGSFKHTPESSQDVPAPPTFNRKIAAPAVNDTQYSYGSMHHASQSDYSALHLVALSQQDANCSVQPYQIQDPAVQPFPPYDSAKATVFRYRQQQSVNLGSW